jgi:hypothetical protein
VSDINQRIGGKKSRLGISTLFSYFSDHEYRKIISWLSQLDFVTRQENINEGRAKGTGSWFLQKDPVLDWIGGNRRLLWVQGGRK